MTVEELTDLIYVPFDRTPGEGSWTSGGFNTVDESKVGPFGKEDVAEVLYGGSSGDGWDGWEAAVIRLKDGRLVAWASFYGPTGDGFHEDAYGGDAEVWFSGPDNLSLLVKQALGDWQRRGLRIPEELWS